MSEPQKTATILDDDVYIIKHLVTLMSQKGYNRVDAKTAINDMIDCIQSSLVNGKTIKFLGFGSFTPKITEARKMKNPLDGSEITTKPKRQVKFKPSNKLKAL